MSLALATLIYEWRRYMAAVIALALSGLLILAMVGMFIGMGKAITATIDRSAADIIILSPKAQNLDDAEGVPSRIRPTLYANPDVKMVTEMSGNGGQFRNLPKGAAKQVSEFVQVRGIDPRPGSANLPPDFSESARRALEQPFAIVVDESSLKHLGVALGDEASINGRRILIGGTVTGYPNMMNTQVFMSPDNMRVLGMTNPGRIMTGPLMVTVKDPARIAIVRDQLNAVAAGKYKAWTRPDLAKANEGIVFREQVVGIMLGFSVLLGIGIGIGITSQTLRGAILANIKEFASLRALGVAMGSLRLVVLELSFWVGIVGIAVSFALTFAIVALANSKNVPMALPLNVVGMVAMLLLVIAMGSGFLSLGLLKKSQPADLLR